MAEMEETTQTSLSDPLLRKNAGIPHNSPQESDVAVELPFTLMHPKPKEELLHREVPENEAPIDTNLIELDTNDDDIVFEDFARQRLKCMKDEEEEADGTNSPQLNDR